MFGDEEMSAYAAKGMAIGIGEGMRALVEFYGLDKEEAESVFLNAMMEAQADYVGVGKAGMKEQQEKATAYSGYAPIPASELKKRKKKLSTEE